MENSNNVANNISEDDIIYNIKTSLHKYKNNEAFYQKLLVYLKNIPNMIEQMEIKNVRRKNYIEEMTHEQEKFIKNFLSKYQYFYLPNEERYFFYIDNKHYIIEDEEHISHKIITSINNSDSMLHNWKFKTSVNILKK